MWNTLLFLTVITLAQVCNGCVHDQFALKTTKHFLNDLTDKRLLAPTQVGRLRIFVDYSLLTVGGDTEINTIKRATNITANYFYNLLNVTRLPRLYYPSNTSRICNSVQVPLQYVTNGTIGDLGVICANQQNTGVQYIAKSTPCAFLESTKRPIWGMMSWNNAFLKFDQVGFQQLLYVGMHEMTHIVGFSAVLYDMYPKGSPLVSGPNGDYYLNSSRLQAEIKNQFNCTKSLGLPLQDQDGTLIASHWEKKVVGNQFMIASLKKGAYVSKFTLALFQSSGWYESVNYNYSQPSVWGKGKGCDFLNIDICQGSQFCQGSNFGCDYQSTGIGICAADPYTGSCQLFKYYTNTICVDENFQMKNLNSKLNALERGGSSSRCFNSDFRQTGLTTTKLNSRCYVSVCSPTGTSVFVLVGSYILVCRTPGQNITAPPGMQGGLYCPKSFDTICSSKKTCPYHCNKNGACIDGKCMCTGSLQLTPSCVDISVYLAPVGTTGGLLNALAENLGSLELYEVNNPSASNGGSSPQIIQVKKVPEYSLNQKCIQGTVLDPDFGDCVLCSQRFGCQSCNDDGCTLCDNGKRPVGKSCFMPY